MYLSAVSSIRTGVRITATSQNKIQVLEYRSQNGDKCRIQKTEENIRTVKRCKRQKLRLMDARIAVDNRGNI